MTAPFNDRLDGDVNAIAVSLRRQTVTVRSGDGAGKSRSSRGARGGQGSGIIWSADGAIVTNAHVATSGGALVTLADGRQFEARVVAHDRRRDLALLRIDAGALSAGAQLTSALPTPVIGAPSTLRAGEVVLALGHPLGVEHALALGVVHAPPDGRGSPYIVADVRLAPGNSGGPLADARGRIVGVNSMIAGGLAIAISTDVVTRFVLDALPRPSMGVELRPIRVRATSGARDMSLGMLVLTVDPSGAAARAGIQQGDVLLGHAGKAFNSPDELSMLIGAAGPQGVLRLDVGHAGRRTSCEVRLPSLLDTARRAA